MISEFISIVQQGSSDLVEVVTVGTAAAKVYKVGGQAMNYLRGFVDRKQEENLHAIGEAARAKLAKLDRNRFSEPSPSICTPLLEAACQESREELQELWACLLANAMTKGNKVRIDFAEVLKQLDPQDALTLSVVKLADTEANPAAAAAPPFFDCASNTIMRASGQDDGPVPSRSGVAPLSVGDLGKVDGIETNRHIMEIFGH